MTETSSTMAERVAEAATLFQLQRTGYPPKAVTVVLSEDTLVITLHGALTPAEQMIATNPAGAAQVQDFHRQLFASSSEELRNEIKRITGVEVREAAAEVEPATGAVVHAFTSGTMIQVFLMSRHLTQEQWGAKQLDGHHKSDGHHNLDGHHNPDGHRETEAPKSP